jgi:hypothetical protein
MSALLPTADRNRKWRNFSDVPTAAIKEYGFALAASAELQRLPIPIAYGVSVGCEAQLFVSYFEHVDEVFVDWRSNVRLGPSCADFSSLATTFDLDFRESELA